MIAMSKGEIARVCNASVYKTGRPLLYILKDKNYIVDNVIDDVIKYVIKLTIEFTYWQYSSATSNACEMIFNPSSICSVVIIKGGATNI